MSCSRLSAATEVSKGLYQSLFIAHEWFMIHFEGQIITFCFLQWIKRFLSNGPRQTDLAATRKSELYGIFSLDLLLSYYFFYTLKGIPFYTTCQNHWLALEKVGFTPLEKKMLHFSRHSWQRNQKFFHHMKHTVTALCKLELLKMIGQMAATPSAVGQCKLALQMAELWLCSQILLMM